MGMDIYGVFSHYLSIDEAVNLPEFIDSWSDIQDLKSDFVSIQGKSSIAISGKSKWMASKAINKSSLPALWDFYASNESFDINLAGVDNIIECFLGWVRIYKHSIQITHWPEHKYANIHDPETAFKMFTINREIAKKFGAPKILYYPDSAFHTSRLDEYIREGKTVDEVINIGINTYGAPPKGLDDARRFMFFVDHIHEPIGQLSAIHDWEGYWKYDEIIKEYVRT